MTLRFELGLAGLTGNGLINIGGSFITNGSPIQSFS